MQHTSYIEISRSAYEHNLAYMKNLFGDEIVFSSVVKGNAYGHGIDTFVPMAMSCGVNHFSVFSADEAMRVHKASDGRVTILILGMINEEQMAWAIEHNIEFYVFDMNRLIRSVRLAKQINKPALVHIEVETGMNRTGFDPKQLSQVIQILQNEADHLIFSGFCTHYAGAESIANYYRVKKQKNYFGKYLKKIKSNHLIPQLIHTACSAAAMRYPSTRMDMVRIGILQYGFFPSREVLIHHLSKTKQQDYPLRRLISWKSTVMDIKTVKAGEFIGYGTSHLANVDMKIATVPVGYSHGFNRSLSNTGRVLIRGQRLGVVGIVNMNMMSIDVTTLPEIEQGDEVVLIGRQGDLEISVASFSDNSNLLNYELLTRLPGDIPRSIVD
jgi:alanine racemase